MNLMNYSRFKDISDWVILENLTIHDFTENENPIEVVKLNIGTYEVHVKEDNHHFCKESYPIIRWITKQEYNKLLENEGTVIW